MKPLYEISSEILKRVVSVSEKLGEVNAIFLQRPSPTLRNQNMLEVIDHSLIELLNFNNCNFDEKTRLDYFVSLGKNEFTRKEYKDVFKDISSATASRDLNKGYELNLFEKIGDLNKTKYWTKT
ncbi:MAG: hypothetical protein WAT79_09085 [Saprospiraceae bacterium]